MKLQQGSGILGQTFVRTETPGQIPSFNANLSRSHIVILDDDRALREEMAETLSLLDVSATAVGTTAQFLEALDCEQPDLIVLDLAMPEKDGIDVLNLLKERNHTGAIAVVSGSDKQIVGAAGRLGTALGLNIVAALSKPVTATEVAKLVQTKQDNDLAKGTKFDEALRNNSIRPFFLPKVDLKSGAIIGAEALSRWDDPGEGLLLPNAYIERLHNTGRQSIHDFRILELTAAACSRFNKAGRRLNFAINFAVEVILSDTFIDAIKDVTARHAIDPSQLTIELSETCLRQNYDEIAERLLHLRLLNIAFSLDGFGAGRSSLIQLQRLPINELKIDRSIVTGMTRFSTDQAIVRSIIDLGHTLNLEVCAQGVECTDTAATLKAMGCDYIQGHIISPGIEQDAFKALVERDASYAF